MRMEAGLITTQEMRGLYTSRCTHDSTSGYYGTWDTNLHYLSYSATSSSFKTRRQGPIEGSRLSSVESGNKVCHQNMKMKSFIHHLL